MQHFPGFPGMSYEKGEKSMGKPDTASAVEKWGNAVYRLACSQVKSRTDADDVFQEVFLRYHRFAPSFQSEEHGKAWLLRVTINCCRTHLAAPWRRCTVPLEDIYTCRAPEESAVAEALQTLPPKDRALIHLFYFEGYPTEEIAGIMGLRPASVRSRLTRARQKLRLLLKEEL